MTLRNKLALDNSVELERAEERISKQRAIQLWQGDEHLKSSRRFISDCSMKFITSRGNFVTRISARAISDLPPCFIFARQF